MISLLLLLSKGLVMSCKQLIVLLILCCGLQASDTQKAQQIRGDEFSNAVYQANVAIDRARYRALVDIEALRQGKCVNIDHTSMHDILCAQNRVTALLHDDSRNEYRDASVIRAQAIICGNLHYKFLEYANLQLQISTLLQARSAQVDDNISNLSRMNLHDEQNENC